MKNSILLLLVPLLLICTKVIPQDMSLHLSGSISTYNYSQVIVKDVEYYKYLDEIRRANYAVRSGVAYSNFDKAVDHYNAGRYKDALYYLDRLHFIGLRPAVHKLKCYSYLKLGRCSKARISADRIKQYDYEMWKVVKLEVNNICTK